MRKIFLAVLILFIVLGVEGQKKRIYIAPDNHTDYMWSGDENTYKQAFLDMLDYYIELNDSTRNEPYSFQSKWNCDGTFWIYIYSLNRPKEQFDRLIRQVREGKITVPMNTLAGLHGAAPAELTLREMYYAGYLERRYGLDLDLVLNMEDQVLPLGLASLWAGAGANYSWRGICACATKVSGFSKRPYEIYWYKGLDDSTVLMKWYSLKWSQPRKDYTALGYYSEARNPANGIALAMDLMNNNPRYPYEIAGVFGQGWDDLTTMNSAFIEEARTFSDSNYEIIVSNETDFFRDFEKTYGNNLPEVSVSYGSTEWGISLASLAEVSASVKRSIEKLRTAEGLYSLVALKRNNFARDLAEMKENAWIACGLYFEHDWTADSKIITKKQRADWQRMVADKLNNYVDTLYLNSLSGLGNLIKKSESSMESFFVYNPLNWPRSDYCDLEYSGTTRIKVIDRISSEEVLHQFIKKNGKTYLRIIADNIPSMGYKTFDISKGPGRIKMKNAVIVKDSTIENKFYRITFSGKGSITSLIDKANGHMEVISPVNGLYANDPGGNARRPIGHITVENQGPVSATLVAQSEYPVRHTSKLTLFRGSERIELENQIDQNIRSEPVTYTFSFNINDPDIWHEEAGAVLNVKPLSHGGHYADSICRVDWIALNHFTALTGNGMGITLSNRDAYFMKTGNSTIEKLDIKTPQVKILAVGQIDTPGLGFVDQDGDSCFQHNFALTTNSGSFNAAQSMRFALEHQNPLVAGYITGDTAVCEEAFSLLSVSNKDVIVWAMKPSEEGIANGLILRIWNMNDKDQKCEITFAYPVKSCKRTTHVETDQSEVFPDGGRLNLDIGHNQIQTYRIFLIH